MERRAHTAPLAPEDRRPSPVPIDARGAGSDPLSATLLDELHAGGVEQRVRAATRLEAFLGLEAIPHLMAALEVEEAPEVLASLFASLGRLGDEEALARIHPHLLADDAGIRSVALEACLRLAPSEAERMEFIETGFADPSPWVRRRTFLAAAAIPGMDMAAWALRFRKDADPHLRRLAYVALATRPEASLVASALDAFLDADEGVRRAAATALERRLGEVVHELVSLPAAEVRRAIAARKAELGAPPPEKPRAEAAPPAPRKRARAEASPEIAFEEIERVLLAAIRGMHLPDLAAALDEDEARVGAAVQSYLVEGRLVLRGSKLYLP